DLFLFEWQPSTPFSVSLHTAKWALVLLKSGSTYSGIPIGMHPSIQSRLQIYEDRVLFTMWVRFLTVRIYTDLQKSL
ncbi:hypothetical protein, partial [Klebsiella variicola]|uniref:hypothetical protein n=1 Tax=Klebsiella variicola TaxID=244366 RepID=UPI0039C001DB